MKSVVMSVFMLVFLIACSDSTQTGPSTDDLSSPNVKIFDNTIKIEYKIISLGKYHFNIYKSSVPGGNKDWILIDSFYVTPQNTHHHKKIEVYDFTVGFLESKTYADYEFKADITKGHIHAVGDVYEVIKNTVSGEESPHIDINKWQWDIHDNTLYIISTYTVNGYHYNETTNLWSDICSVLPCGPWVIIPDFYAEGHIYTTTKALNISGPEKNIIIQLWKGFCPRFTDLNSLNTAFNKAKETPGIGDIIKSAGIVSNPIDLTRYNSMDYGDDFPGGIGAEVGIYEEYSAGSNQFIWKPLVKSGINISFELINPESENRDTVVHAEKKETWWRTRWMSTDSYNYKYIKLHKVPLNPLKYELHYNINGVKGIWKASDKLFGTISMDN